MHFAKTREHVQKKIGLDLDVTSKSDDKEKLDSKLLTRAVVYEIHTFAVKKAQQYLPCTVFDILDYNFDQVLGIFHSYCIQSQNHDQAI